VSNQRWASDKASVMAKAQFFSLLFCVLLTSCGMVSDMAEVQKKSEAISVALEKELGVKPFVGWNIHNGTLTNVNVNFPLDGVAKLTAGDLDAKVRAVVSQHFEKPPEQLVVSTFSKQ
jgi:hypothetical protein